METCVLIPRQLSVVLLPTGRPGHHLEMGATLWANCALRPGCTFLPDEGELRLDRLEIFSDLSEKDVRRRYGCFDEVLVVDKREVRHCNWVRFLHATCNMNEVNIVAHRLRHKPEFHVVKPIPVNGELKSSFSRSPFDGSPLSKLRRQLLPASAAADMTSLDDADMSPTDLSMRKETSSFTSPSSGFDSPSMHYSGHLTDGTQEPHGTNVTSSGSGSLSDAVVADHSRSSTVSPSSSDRQKLSPVPDTDGGSEHEAGDHSGKSSDEENSSAASCRQSPSSRDAVLGADDDKHDFKSSAASGSFSLPSLPLPVRRKEKTWLPCDVCGKKFDRPSLLKRHMRTHTGEKPHECDVCFKAFSTSSSLNTHRRIHSGEKPHECPVCGKRFTASSNLYYHRMTHKKEKPHKCLLCSKSFPTPGDLKSHMYVHSGSWPYKCDVCNRGFSKQANLKNHLLLHTGDKPHSCDLCGKKFALLCNLKTHVKMHEEEALNAGQERCDTCGQIYTVSRQSPTGNSKSPTSNKCPVCAGTRDRPQSRDPASVSTPFSIDSLVGPKNAGSDVTEPWTPSSDTKDGILSPVSLSRSMTSRWPSPGLPLTSVAQPLPQIQATRFPFSPAVAAAHAQYYALAASGILPPLHFGNGARFPVSLMWPPKSQQFGV